MNVLALALAAAVLGAADPPKGDANKKDLERLQGVWRLRCMKADGEEVVEPSSPVQWVDISGSQLVWVLGHIGSASGTLKTDATKDPARFDVPFVDDPVTWRGIYEVKGDTLRLCFIWEKGRELPKGFDAKKGPPNVLYILKREKTPITPRPTSDRRVFL